MARFSVCAVAGIVLALPNVALASHLDCARPWPGTPTEANQAWADCKARDAAEHVQIMKDAQQRQAEERAREAAERQRQQEQEYQRAMDERRVRALEEAARAQKDAADATNTPQQTTCGWEYSFSQGRVWTCRRGPVPRYCGPIGCN